ncbi:SAM-dependent methyltransferase [Lentilactobacillus sp. IMAU92037]|uniref:SAM-dependent methyltransferase n=1 Tax=Lentilactobacillus dabitei TaxID=2831523 RepID=UPI001C2C0E4F|nr:SAM-dependent methyltransferase [Lentilactobacillus dabitei]MBV0929478.1 SAM-dependent methyltransferase [Lentilactobacillus dabitei]
MLTNKQKKKLLKHKSGHKTSPENSYITQMLNYREMFSDYPQIKFLINNIIESDHLIKSGLLPQDLPELLLPDDSQDQIFQHINQTFAKDDPAGDHLWNQLTDALPKLDKLLRSYRDYLEAQYGIWAYISAPFIKDLAKYIGQDTALEIMAGNGYISKGLKDLGANIYPTDSLEWVNENQTGKHQVIPVEKLDALAAINQYQDRVKYVIMSWSPDKSPIDVDVLNAIRNSKNNQLELIVIGEKNGATNSKQFWSQAHYIKPETSHRLNQHHQPFDLIKDQVYLVD